MEINDELQDDLTACHIDNLQRRIHEQAVAKGWWNQPRDVPHCLALIHSELSEALEDYRMSTPQDPNLCYEIEGKPGGILVELADAMIRILDLAEHIAPSVSFGRILLDKMAYNATRPHRHGGKRA
jgi:hypothetical protein